MVFFPFFLTHVFPSHSQKGSHNQVVCWQRGDLELLSHRTVVAELIAVNSAATNAVVPPVPPSPSVSEGSPVVTNVAPTAPPPRPGQASGKQPHNPFILDSDSESSHSSPNVAPAAQPPSHCLGPPSWVTKRPQNPFTIPTDSDTDPEIVLDEDPPSNPKAKKAKKTTNEGASATSALHADVLIISIDDIEDPQDEWLNKTDPTAYIREFFIAVSAGPGSDKTHMKCTLCKYVYSFFSSLILGSLWALCVLRRGLGCPKQIKMLTSQHSMLCHHTASAHTVLKPFMLLCIGQCYSTCS